MKKELPYFRIGTSYGGDQSWYRDPTMRYGGCAASVACDCCLYLDLYFGTRLYPFDINHITRQDYVEFGRIMKDYLHPRIGGINRPELFVSGMRAYLRDERETCFGVEGFSGHQPLQEAVRTVKHQLDLDRPVPYLNLLHRDSSFRNYRWHWFTINGYDSRDDRLMVKAVTYGGARWIDFKALWESGWRKKGGMILWTRSRL